MTKYEVLLARIRSIERRVASASRSAASGGAVRPNGADRGPADGAGTPLGSAEADSAPAPAPAPKFEIRPASPPPGVRVVSISAPDGSPLLPFDGSDPGASEEYRIVRTKIMRHPRQPRVFVVTSATPGDGKTTNAINLSGAFALKTGLNVLLVDADLRRASVSRALGIPAAPGLSEMLEEKAQLEEALIRLSRHSNLYVLPAGNANMNPAELLDSPQWRNLAEELRGRFHYVVLDSPPIAAVADYDMIETVADGVVMVVRQDHSCRTLVYRALGAIPREKLLGVMINCVDERYLRKERYGYYYYYSGGKKQ